MQTQRAAGAATTNEESHQEFLRLHSKKFRTTTALFSPTRTFVSKYGILSSLPHSLTLTLTQSLTLSLTLTLCPCASSQVVLLASSCQALLSVHRLDGLSDW